MFVIVSAVIISLMTGFWIGRSLQWKMAESGEEFRENDPIEFGFRQEKALRREEGPKREEGPWREESFQGERASQEERPEQRRSTRQEERNVELYEHGEERKRRHGEKVISTGWAIGSPCAGDVSFFYEGTRRGAVIQANQGLVYAPAAGKIIRLYPMGNAFLLRTEFGVELLIRIGDSADELLSMYYRPRIVQNEIVNKGKLLLEYDLEGLQAEGVESSVSVSVEAAEDYRDILVTGQKHVRVGEEVLWVREKKRD